MQPIQRGSLEKEIESAVVTFSDTGKTYVLGVINNSVCHFFEKFKVGNDEVQLRLDWSDIDQNGYPMLDADFRNIYTCKKVELKGIRYSSHHTRAIEGSGRAYSWEFQNYTCRFKVQITWLASGICNISSSAVGAPVVIKGNDALSCE